MSGEKYGQTRLNARREAALVRCQDLKARLQQTRTAHIRLDVEFLEFAKRHGTNAAAHMAAEYQECVQAKARLDGADSELASIEQEVTNLTVPLAEPDLPAFDQTLSRFEAAVAAPSTAQQEASSALRRGMDNVRTDLQSRMDAAERERCVQAERRARLRGIAEDYRARARVDAAMRRVTEDAEALLEKVESAGSLEEADIVKFEKDVDELVHKAWDRELTARRQQHTADLVCVAFDEAGFTKKEEAWETGASDVGEIRLVHEVSQAELSVRVSSSIQSDQSIHLLMEGASGQARDLVQPTPFCGDSLDDIIQKAKAIGLIIEGVTVKGPDGFWRDLSTQDESDDDFSVQQSLELAQRQAANRRT